MSRQPEFRDTRHITLARALHARLYVNVDGRIHSVGGRPVHAKLAQFLARQDRRPTAVEAPSPRDLGISSCDGELGPHQLHDIGRALNRWRKELEAEFPRRPARRRVKGLVVGDQQEMERLSARLRAVLRWQQELVAGGEPAGAPFFLDPAAEDDLNAAVRAAEEPDPLPPLIVWQARLVCWLAGGCAMRRFLDATVGLFRLYPRVSHLEQVRGFHLHERRTEVPSKDQLHRWHCVPAALAALTATDGSTVALPQRCFQAGAELESFTPLLRTIAELAEQAGEPRYDALLGAIDQLPPPPAEFNYGQLRQLLGQGCSLADAVWACEQDLVDSLNVSCLRVPAVRRLSETFQRCRLPLSAYDLSRLVCRIRQPEHLAAIKAWLAWLGAVSPRTVTPRIVGELWAAFWDLYLPSIQRHRWADQLAACLTPPRRCKDPSDAAPLLERVIAYQQFAGKRAVLPKSVRRVLEFRERRECELAHLRERLAAGPLNALALARLNYLVASGAGASDGNLRRATEEVFLLLGLDAQRTVARRLAAATCREQLGELASLLPPNLLWDCAGWIETMNEAERRRLRAVIAAWHAHGRNYKQHLVENQPWIARAQRRGLDLEPWFLGEPHFKTIGERTMEITLATQLHDIFLMGAYFRTCLSLGGVNEMSVLTNAFDANKQVVFMFTRDDDGQRQVVARQLLAISGEFKLLGYCCYMNWRHTDKTKREEGLAAMAAFCGRLAARCGLELADQGAPEAIGDHFWYDDDACEWSAAAREAVAQYVCGAKSPPTMVRSSVACLPGGSPLLHGVAAT